MFDSKQTRNLILGGVATSIGLISLVAVLLGPFNLVRLLGQGIWCIAFLFLGTRTVLKAMRETASDADFQLTTKSKKLYVVAGGLIPIAVVLIVVGGFSAVVGLLLILMVAYLLRRARRKENLDKSSSAPAGEA